MQKRLQPTKRRSKIRIVDHSELSWATIEAYEMTTWLMTQPTRNRWRRQRKRQPGTWLRKEARGDEGVFPTKHTGMNQRGVAKWRSQTTQAPVVGQPHYKAR